MNQMIEAEIIQDLLTFPIVRMILIQVYYKMNPISRKEQIFKRKILLVQIRLYIILYTLTMLLMKTLSAQFLILVTQN